MYRLNEHKCTITWAGNKLILIDIISTGWHKVFGISNTNLCWGPSTKIIFPGTVHSRYLAPVGSQNSRARVKWFSRYLARFRAKAQTRDFQDQSPTLWRLHLLNPNSMLSDNWCTYISRISADVDIAPATNHNKSYYILIIMHQKLSNYMLHKAAYDGICAETIQTTEPQPRCGLTGNGNNIITRSGFHRNCMSFLMKNSRIAFQITLISALPV